MVEGIKEQIKREPITWIWRGLMAAGIVAVLWLKSEYVHKDDIKNYVTAESFQRHVDNKDIHLTYREQADQFVSRLEFRTYVESQNRANEDLKGSIKELTVRIERQNDLLIQAIKEKK